ncbi:Branched-chain amino acid transport protein [Dehalogenimonas formicexedens]|uniref:Branched-chain amino acid transport protein n=1 Tax=Dehalogenimonas formicexedens TaxID=1839801 RepID=A0A1P8F7W9_9CHLR|nr:AzlD domain-containing protein [Dehalogenimonas formicexedens]APV44576.1 Branched-chain amino acid transport protein [Dehalogenimonas formicexedens]
MRLEMFLLFTGMAAVTFLPRFLPMALVSRIVIPEKAKAFLEYIPVAVLSALVVPAVFAVDGGGVGLDARLLVSALVVFVFAWKMRNLFGSVIIGMATYWLMGVIGV